MRKGTIQPGEVLITPKPEMSDNEDSNHSDHQKSIAHLVNDIAVNVVHVRQHLGQAIQAAKDGDHGSAQFNYDHADTHMGRVEEHLQKLVNHIAEHPEVAAEYDKVTQTPSPHVRVALRHSPYYR